MTRISAAAVLFAVACGGASSRPADPCVSYGATMRAPLARLERAADEFGDASMTTPAEGARASRNLAGRLEAVHGDIAAARIEVADLRRAHDELAAALGQMSGALTHLAEVLEARDEGGREGARRGLRVASERWGRAVTEVRRICPGL